MKIFLWSFLGALCFFIACQRQDINDQLTTPEQQEAGATDRDEEPEFNDFVSYVVEGSTSSACCTADYCKYITSGYGNILCGYDYSSIWFQPGSFAYHIFTPSSTNSTVKVRYRLIIVQYYPPAPPGQPQQGPRTIVDVTAAAGFLPICQERIVALHPSFTPDCNSTYKIIFQIIQGLPNGTTQVCTTNIQDNVSFCASGSE